MVETPKSETLTDNKKYTTLTHHNKTTQKIDKSFKNLRYAIVYTTNNKLPKTPHKHNHTRHKTRKTHTHRGIKT